jgi:hypothetical protein
MNSKVFREWIMVELPRNKSEARCPEGFYSGEL